MYLNRSKPANSTWYMSTTLEFIMSKGNAIDMLSRNNPLWSALTAYVTLTCHTLTNVEIPSLRVIYFRTNWLWPFWEPVTTFMCLRRILKVALSYRDNKIESWKEFYCLNSKRILQIKCTMHVHVLEFLKSCRIIDGCFWLNTLIFSITNIMISKIKHSLLGKS